MQESFTPIGGTPIIPPSYLTVYFIFFLVFLSLLYFYFYKKRRPIVLWQKIKLLLLIAIILKVALVAGVGLVAAYWLIPTPGIRRTIPSKETNTFSPTQKIEIVFDRPVSRKILEKSITPDVPGQWVFENSIYTTHLYRNLVFYPKYSLRPDTTYTIKLAEIKNLLNISPSYKYEYSFRTQPSPKVLAVSPVSGQHEVGTTEKIKVTLDNPNDNVSEFSFEFIPKVEYKSELDSSKTAYILTPTKSLDPGIEYNLKIQKSDVILNLEDKTVIERSPSALVYDGTFKTKADPDKGNIILETFSRKRLGIVSITPENNWTAVSVESPIKVIFDQSVNHFSAEQRFSISPKVEGKFSWDNNTLIFTPDKSLDFGASYTVTIASGIESLAGLPSEAEIKSTFSTQSTTTKLAVPAYLQKYTLSCEIASLRMALNFKGANVTEDDLIPKVGTDTTPHNGNTWGNPYNAFVGNIRGTQMADGYGVYWGPIAKAARSYRNAQEFEGWNIQQLTEALSNNNPVVIWVYSHFGTKTSWNTPDGTQIYAVRDEHAVVAVGFVGPANNPTQMIINDPLVGQVYWSRSVFDKKWDIFGRSGVVVY